MMMMMMVVWLWGVINLSYSHFIFTLAYNIYNDYIQLLNKKCSKKSGIKRIYVGNELFGRSRDGCLSKNIGN